MGQAVSTNTPWWIDRGSTILPRSKFSDRVLKPVINQPRGVAERPWFAATADPDPVNQAVFKVTTFSMNVVMIEGEADGV